MDRNALLLGTATKDSLILEIGPSHAPVAPKSGGWKTHIVDHADQDGLREKYAAMGVDVSAIEAVDTVWQGVPLDQCVPVDLVGRFDTLIASHVIEHIPDFISFLKSAERLMAPHGVIALAIPDPRYCFDYFKPRSTTGDVLEAYALRRTGHSIRALWNHAAYSADMDGTGAWAQHPVSRPSFLAPFADAAALAVDLLRNAADQPYRDTHTWAFTPAGFRLTMLELAQLGLVDWQIDSMDGPHGCEFIVHLRRGITRVANQVRLDAQRMELLVQQLRESVEQLSFAEGLVQAASLPADVLIRLDRIERQLEDGDERLIRLEGLLEHIDRRLDNYNERLTGLESVLARLVSVFRPFLPIWRLIRPRR